jgi:hypothetical protein
MPEQSNGGGFIHRQIGFVKSPPNYQPQPARFGQMCRNCKSGEYDGKVERCKKYEQIVRPNWF